MNLIKDGRALPAQSEDIDTRLCEETKAACRRVIAANAVGADLDEMVADAELIMMALGVHPAQRDEDFLEEENPFIAYSRSASRG